MMNSYVCIDLETTGLNPKTDKITEIGAVKVIDGIITDTYSTFVNPGRKLEERIVELTGIHDEDLCDAPVINDAFDEINRFIGDLPLLGHSILFDYSFLKKAAVDKKYVFEKKAVDTLKLARKYLPELESRSLEALCEHYKIPHQAHRAMEDAKATVELYNILCRQFYKEGEALFQPEQLHFKVKRDQPASKAQKEKLYLLTAQHKIIPEVDIEMLSRSEASRMTDCILAIYGRV